MTSTVTTRGDADRVAAMVADGLGQLLDAEYWKFSGDDLLDTARGIERLARQVYAVQVAVAGEADLARLAHTHGQPSTGALLRQGDGIALEPQLFPDSPNRPDFPTATLHLGETYRSRMAWLFGAAG